MNQASFPLEFKKTGDFRMRFVYCTTNKNCVAGVFCWVLEKLHIHESLLRYRWLHNEIAPFVFLLFPRSHVEFSGAETDEPTENSDAAEDYKPVNVDMNLVKHLLESTASQGGMSGPASNMLRSMGLGFPSMPTGSETRNKFEELWIAQISPQESMYA